MRGRIAGGVANAQVAMPEEHPHAAGGIELKRGKVVVALHVSGQSFVDIRNRLLPSATCVYRESQGAPLIQSRALPLHQEAGVLAPLEAAFIPCRPDAILLIATQADVGLVLRRVGDRRDVRPGAAGEPPDLDVVI